MPPKLIKRAARTGLEAISAVRPRHWDALKIALSPPSSPVPAGPAEARAAVDWIKRAHDAAGGQGVSWGYRARAAIRSGQRVGWQPAYPETSGYIIETLLRFGDRFNDPGAIESARRIADWEVEIQLPDGGFQGGMIGAHPVESSTFVTGQVLFGLAAAHARFGGDAYARAAARACEFLLSCLDENGRFQKGYSHFCAPGPKAYEVRTGWAMMLAGKRFEIPAAVEGGARTAEFALQCQRPNAWFAENDLEDHNQPLTHTIGYTLEGLFEIGVLLERKSLWEAVRKTLLAMRPLIQFNGFLAGRWNKNWQPAASWSCLTGSSQIALVCFRMHRHYSKDGFHEMGARLLDFVASCQKTSGSSPALAGSIHGSSPFGGDYCKYCSPNWAAKFFVDAVLDRLAAQK